mgnify:CR=1 FL=1|jgi:hypothetical protein
MKTRQKDDFMWKSENITSFASKSLSFGGKVSMNSVDKKHRLSKSEFSKT